MKRIVLLGFFLLMSLGCSGRDWLAKFYLVKAEDLHLKAYSLRLKKVPYEERLKYYRQACGYFQKAYRLNPRAFTLFRIESAAESCLRVKNTEGEEEFKRFLEDYAKAHPTEVEYGDAFPAISAE
ncbi:MAG: hypothetical protein HY447_02035 [Candidatus Omnitrophica bacterium]|nr:hypothetical protein [Candidatus Omnitrophota bacterium]